jgi:predicted Zn-dependent protease
MASRFVPGRAGAIAWLLVLAAALGLPAHTQTVDELCLEARHIPLHSSMSPELQPPPALPPDSPPPDVRARRRRDVRYDVGRIGERGVGDGINIYSLEREQTLGRELAQDVDEQARFVRDPAISEYINRVAQNLVRNSDAKVPFTVKVIDNDEVNAFALPGGFFYVDSGLILAADNEAQLAGVMAHEIAHVAARHATKNATRMQILNVASIPLIFFGGPAGYAVRQLATMAVPMSLMKFSRDAEREADLLGLEYAYSAGYDPAEFVNFFETLHVRQKERLSFVARAFASHPMTKERIARAQKEIADMLPAKNEYVVSTSEFDEIKTRLAGLENQDRINAGHTDAPVLRKRPPNSKNGDDNGPVLRKP